MELFFIGGIIFPLFILSIFLSWKYPLAFLALHISSRAILDAFSFYTYQPVVHNISFMQIYSMCIIILLSLLLISRKHFCMSCLPAFLPISLILFSIIISGFINNNWFDVIEISVKWIYLILISGLVVYILNIRSFVDLIYAVWLSLIPSLILQLPSIIFSDFVIASGGHAAYFGGYYHQNILSYFLFGFIVCSAYLFLHNNSSNIRWLYFISGSYGMFSLYLCGYRTTLIAVFIFIITIISYIFKNSNHNRKALFTSFTPIIIFFFVFFLGNDITDKLSDIYIFLKSPLSYLNFSQISEHITLFSGRIIIINNLMFVFLSSPLETLIAGLGINASISLVGTYPHNEFIAALVEFGFLGLLSFLTFILYYMYSIYRSHFKINIDESVFIGAALGLLCMTLATMPFRDMRAMMLFGLIIGIFYFKIHGVTYLLKN